ncbi:response regulator [Calderihabitans maritimus]|uniref:Stage 0 sporulation protein A homolog n=1 Tax=Calderihabitans maritimus TaxID=1246530 RepID=A0A1Z5HP04_9FIRM|nr:response regulator transcription factor [Calderihabitans maritimus]GAW91244.1 response regulator containing a CheY-like receiver domain and an HTH DNA-binding domain [Calderihabitans maritimus]
MQQRKLKVLLVDDHVVLLSGLCLLLENTNDLEVVGKATDRMSALEQCRKLKPDVLLLDINLGDNSGLDLIPEVQRISPETNILLLTMYDEEDYLQRALELGARGYILKKASDQELLAAVRAVGQGGTYLDPAIATSVVNLALGRKKKGEERPSSNGVLSSREKEVLGLVALGYTNQQIADELTISIKTVETHKANIKEKLGIKKRSDLVRYALENNLMPEK